MCIVLTSHIRVTSLSHHPEDVGHQKVAAQYLRRELQEADEANLLDEEELCKSFSSSVELEQELDAPAVNKKPPRKERKKIAAESPSNSVTKNLCKTTAKILPHVPAPIATKIYYSQRNYNLRRAIRRMFFEEPRKESSNEVSNSETVQRDDHFLHLAQTPDRILAAKSGGTTRSMTKASQLPVNNNTLVPHYISNSYSGTLHKGSGSVPVV
ncbi:PREDICTED: uncharacterized protein LOC105949221 [Erythranthe guttata]|uniref:uncharacterized protein LOC105949221 n=1 Tax=Erythranthe guttata TaxID=4155 RepID=UPI00064D988B|nr:PREDICTED: uncharacterized protein LOC105949221 [Erythranthe guttata]|eukprot:XP_012827973.1 PREDICTED: uncharacterized protein LOC105949221 [Erythranthe guttata]